MGKGEVGGSMFEGLQRVLVRRLSLSERLSSGRVLSIVSRLVLGRVGSIHLTLGRGMRLHRRLFCSIHGLSILRRLISSRAIARVVMGKPSAVFMRQTNGLVG